VFRLETLEHAKLSLCCLLLCSWVVTRPLSSCSLYDNCTIPAPLFMLDEVPGGVKDWCGWWGERDWRRVGGRNDGEFVIRRE
jgi:hypothetical protein